MVLYGLQNARNDEVRNRSTIESYGRTTRPSPVTGRFARTVHSAQMVYPLSKDPPTPVITTNTRYEQSIYLYSRPLAADIAIPTPVECDGHRTGTMLFPLFGHPSGRPEHWRCRRSTVHHPRLSRSDAPRLFPRSLSPVDRTKLVHKLSREHLGEDNFLLSY